MEEPYFGAEFIEGVAGAITVPRRRAATCLVVGTAPIEDVHATAEDRAPFINKYVQPRTREEAVAAFGNHRAGFTIPAALDALFDHAGAEGIGEIDVINVYDPDVHVNGPGDVTNLDIIGAFDALGNATGLKLAYEAYQRFGRFPKIIIAPGFSGLTGVRAELVGICNRIGARAIIDAPAGVSRQQVIEARGPLGAFDLTSNSRRLVYTWPHMKVVDLETGDERIDPYSSRLAGVWLSSILRYGYHESPSNRPIEGIEDAAQQVLYVPGDRQSDIQALRQAGVVTSEARFGKPPHVSGNRSAAHPTDTDIRNLLHVQFTEDMLIEEGLEFLDQFKDRSMNPQRIEIIEDRMNAYLQDKTLGDNPVISDGQFRFDRRRTTPDSVARGQFHFSMPWAPIGIGERLTVTQSIDINLLSNPLGLSSS